MNTYAVLVCFLAAVVHQKRTEPKNLSAQREDGSQTHGKASASPRTLKTSEAKDARTFCSNIDGKLSSVRTRPTCAYAKHTRARACHNCNNSQAKAADARGCPIQTRVEKCLPRRRRLALYRRFVNHFHTLEQIHLGQHVVDVNTQQPLGLKSYRCDNSSSWWGVGGGC